MQPSYTSERNYIRVKHVPILTHLFRDSQLRRFVTKSQVNGLVHISQLADEFVANCDDHVKEGDMVRRSDTYICV